MQKRNLGNPKARAKVVRLKRRLRQSMVVDQLQQQRNTTTSQRNITTSQRHTQHQSRRSRRPRARKYSQSRKGRREGRGTDAGD